MKKLILRTLVLLTIGFLIGYFLVSPWLFGECVVPNTIINQGETAQAWHNYRTGATDFFNGSLEDYSDYIPQQTAVQMIYQVYLKSGLSPEDACLETLNIYIKRQEELDELQHKLEPEKPAIKRKESTKT